MVQRTLLIIKPDATERNLVGQILSRVEAARFRIVAMKMVHLERSEARKFYAVHEGKPFLDDLVDFMSSGPVVPVVLEKENAILDLRDLAGATDPENAASGTIRDVYGKDIQCNSVHASDGEDTARNETRFFFPDL